MVRNTPRPLDTIEIDPSLSASNGVSLLKLTKKQEIAQSSVKQQRRRRIHFDESANQLYPSIHLCKESAAQHWYTEVDYNQFRTQALDMVTHIRNLELLSPDNPNVQCIAALGQVYAVFQSASDSQDIKAAVMATKVCFQVNLVGLDGWVMADLVQEDRQVRRQRLLDEVNYIQSSLKWYVATEDERVAALQDASLYYSLGASMFARYLAFLQTDCVVSSV